VDALSEILDSVKLEGAIFFNAELTAPWGFRFAAVVRSRGDSSQGTQTHRHLSVTPENSVQRMVAVIPSK
jgi:hypothetical protein